MSSHVPVTDLAPHLGGPLYGLDIGGDNTKPKGDGASIVPSLPFNAKATATMKTTLLLPCTDIMRPQVNCNDIHHRVTNRPFGSPLARVPIQGSKDRMHTHRRSRVSLPSSPAHNAAPTPQMRPFHVPNLQEFKIVRPVGAGHFGDVFLAYHKSSRVQVALKTISKKSPPLPGQRGRGDRRAGEPTMQRCGGAMEEYFALRRLSGTAGIAEILASFHDTRYFYIGMVCTGPPSWSYFHN